MTVHPSENPEILAVLAQAADSVTAVAGEAIGTLVHQALVRTLRDTIHLGPDNTAFVITGDIPAMWLRDSTTQLTPYLRFISTCAPLADLVIAISRRQFQLLDHDPYANAFNDGPTGARYDPDDVCADPHVWEQKYEIDSIAYPISLAYDIWLRTERTDHCDEVLHRVLHTVVAQLRLEQDHDQSQYRFTRDTPLVTETLARDGRGTPVARTSMTWSGFRPSDDACTYGYNIPGNLFVAQALRRVVTIATEIYQDAELALAAGTLAEQIVAGVREFGIVPGPHGSSIYAYEVDGLGGVLCMDDANTPSLLSLPLLAPEVIDLRLWQATREFVLSPANPYFFSGTYASGIGSPHTLPDRIWPIALAVQGLTGSAPERRRLLELLAATDAGTGHIHESFDPNDPQQFSRDWFSWADSMMCELALTVVDDHGTPRLGPKLARLS